MRSRVREQGPAGCSCSPGMVEVALEIPAFCFPAMGRKSGELQERERQAQHHILETSEKRAFFFFFPMHVFYTLGK